MSFTPNWLRIGCREDKNQITSIYLVNSKRSTEDTVFKKKKKGVGKKSLFYEKVNFSWSEHPRAILILKLQASLEGT